MPRYKVELWRPMTYSESAFVEVEADTPEAAEDLALALGKEDNAGAWYSNDDDQMSEGISVWSSEEIKEQHADA